MNTQLTQGQIDVVIEWMNGWDVLKNTAIPIRFKEAFTPKLEQIRLTKEQVIADIELCKVKIKEALDYDVYSVLPLYTEILDKLHIELNNFGLQYTTIGKGVQQKTTIESDIKAGDVVEMQGVVDRLYVEEVQRHGVKLVKTMCYPMAAGNVYLTNYKDMPFKKVN